MRAVTTPFVIVAALSAAVASACALAAPPPSGAGALRVDTLHAFTDFEVAGGGDLAPYYRDERGTFLAIDAAQHRDRAARAVTMWRGPAGVYDLTLVTGTESDGESTYSVFVGGKSLEPQVNPAGLDGRTTEITWKDVRLPRGARIAVESNTVSNRKVPEGDGFGYARGRWRALIVTPAAQ